MKKTQVRKLQLNRETLRRLKSEDFAVIYGGDTDWQTVPSCIDGCPSAMCTSIVPTGGG
jgi:hypothetical protein